MRDQIESRHENYNDNKPVGRVVSRTGAGEGDDRTFRSPEGAPLSLVRCPSATSSGGEADASNLEGGQDVESSEVESCIVLGEEGIPTSSGVV